jgi:GNAT superfamily N-acetyltransferase
MRHTVPVRPLRSTERDLLATATLGAMNWCGDRFTAAEVETRPEFSHYTVLAPQRGDYGWVADTGAEAVGVVWAQYLPADDPGYGFLAEGTPEMSLWVRSGWRGQGIGRALLRCLQDEARSRRIARISLSVESGNHARRLYVDEGFVPVPGREADGVMAWTA